MSTSCQQCARWLSLLLILHHGGHMNASIYRLFCLYDDFEAMSIDEQHKRAQDIIYQNPTAFNLQLEKSTTKLQAHTAPITALSLSADSTRMVSSSYDKTAIVWDVDLEKKLATLEHEKEVLAAAIKPDGSTIVTGLADGAIHMWETLTYTAVRTFAGHNDYIRTIVWSKDGKKFATASWDGTAKIWDDQGNHQLTIAGHAGAVTSVCFSGDGEHIITASCDGIIMIWNSKTGALLQTLHNMHALHAVAISPDGCNILGALENGALMVWFAPTYNLFATYKESIAPICCVSFDATGMKCITGSYDHTACIWNNVLRVSCLRLAGHTKTVIAAVFTADNNKTITASHDGTIQIWDLTPFNAYMAGQMSVKQALLIVMLHMTHTSGLSNDICILAQQKPFMHGNPKNTENELAEILQSFSPQVMDNLIAKYQILRDGKPFSNTPAPVTLPDASPNGKKNYEKRGQSFSRFAPQRYTSTSRILFG